MTSPSNRSRRAFRWCVAALLGCAATGALAVTLAQKAKEMGCTDKPVRIPGTALYKCTQGSGVQAFFDVPDGTAESAPAAKPSPAARPATSPSPASFPKIDAGTQKSRDDLRRKVLQDELANEEKLLAEARSAWGEGSPPPLPEEKANAQKYADRIARLRQAVQLHERNVDALKRELGTR